MGSPIFGNSQIVFTIEDQDGGVGIESLCSGPNVEEVI